MIKEIWVKLENLGSMGKLWRVVGPEEDGTKFVRADIAEDWKRELDIYREYFGEIPEKLKLRWLLK